MSLLKNASLLRYLANQNPRLWEILHPHVPLVSEGARYLLTAILIRSVASKISNATVTNDLKEAGKNVFETGLRLMTYENTIWPSGDEVTLNPQPEPPGRPEYYGALLILIADSITSAELKITADTLR